MFLAIYNSLNSWALDNWLTILIVYLVILLAAYALVGPRNLEAWQQLGALFYGGLAGLTTLVACLVVLFYLMFQLPLFNPPSAETLLGLIAELAVGLVLHFAVVALSILAGLWVFSHTEEYLYKKLSMSTTTAVAGTVVGTTVGLIVAIVLFLFIVYVAFIAIAAAAAGVALIYGMAMMFMILLGSYAKSK